MDINLDREVQILQNNKQLITKERLNSIPIYAYPQIKSKIRYTRLSKVRRLPNALKIL